MQPRNPDFNNSFDVALSRGDVAGAKVVHKFGAAADVTTTLTPITAAKVYPVPTTPTSLEIVSDDNINDIPAGAGARVVRVIGISNWTGGEVTEDVVLTGTSPVALSTQFLRVYRMFVTESGTYATATAPSHSSTLTLRVAGVGATWAIIENTSGFGESQTEIAVYSVPENQEAYVRFISAYVETNKAADLIFFVREQADVITAPFGPMRAKLHLRNVVNHIPLSPVSPLGPFTGPCDMGWMGRSTATTANIEVDYEILVMDK